MRRGFRGLCRLLLSGNAFGGLRDGRPFPFDGGNTQQTHAIEDDDQHRQLVDQHAARHVDGVGIDADQEGPAR